MALRIVLSLTRSTSAASWMVSKPGAGAAATGPRGKRPSGPRVADNALLEDEVGKSPAPKDAARLLRRLGDDWGFVRLMIGNDKKTDHKRGDACGLFVTYHLI